MENYQSNIIKESCMNDAIETFMLLFGGRTDAYGTWEGGSNKSQVTYETFAKHLYGEELIGIYPLTDGSSVRWGCSDIDVDDIDSARNLQTALKIKSINSFVEKTRRGYHVWVFANDWVPAAVMRRAFLSAHEAVNLVAKEVNPKQEEATGLGNYVRLPYPAGIDNIPENRYMLLDKDDSPMPLKDFLHEAYETRTNINLLSPLAEKHKPRSKVHFNNLTISPSVNTSLDKVNGYIATIWRNGPMEGNDRSNTLIRMCHYMFEYGTPINDAYTILVDADKRWGKFHLREDCVEQLTKIVEDEKVI
jgi:hypothetical protein